GIRNNRRRLDLVAGDGQAPGTPPVTTGGEAGRSDRPGPARRPACAAFAVRRCRAESPDNQWDELDAARCSWAPAGSRRVVAQGRGRLYRPRCLGPGVEGAGTTAAAR